MWEDFINALHNFTQGKTRSVLSLLGIIIGVASVIIITSMGQASTKEISDSFGSCGLNIVQVQKGFMRKKRSVATIKFDETFRSDLFDNIDNIRRVWYKNSMSPTISYGDTSSQSSCAAVEYGYIQMYGLQLSQGRSFSATEDYYGLQKIVLGSNIATSLFDDKRAVGKNVLVVLDKVSFSFEVVGVLKDQESGFEDAKNSCYIPRGFYSKKIQPNPNAQSIMVEVTASDKATAVVNAISDYCNAITGAQYSVSVMSMQTFIEQISDMQNKMSVLLAAIAAISLLVGGIGIMNIMIITVTERKKEIGIRKALGATRFAITRQFLVEASTITLVGGAAGVIIGVLISIGIEAIKKQGFIIDIGACLVAFVFSVLVGIFFGLSPALKAAKLDPVVALQSE